MWKLWLHVSLLCVMLVVVGIMTRCAIPVVSCMHGHLDMLMGNPWFRGKCGLLVSVLCMVYPMHLDAVKDTHNMVALPLSYCIQVMGGALGLL